MIGFPKLTPRIHDRAARQRATKAHWQAAQRAVWQRDGFRCVVCGKRLTHGSVDSLEAGHVHHLVLRSRGRDDSLGNLVLLCARCHADVHAHRLTLSGRASALTVTRESA